MRRTVVLIVLVAITAILALSLAAPMASGGKVARPVSEH